MSLRLACLKNQKERKEKKSPLGRLCRRRQGTRERLSREAESDLLPAGLASSGLPGRLRCGHPLPTDRKDALKQATGARCAAHLPGLNSVLSGSVTSGKLGSDHQFPSATQIRSPRTDE